MYHNGFPALLGISEDIVSIIPEMLNYILFPQCTVTLVNGHWSLQGKVMTQSIYTSATLLGTFFMGLSPLLFRSLWGYKLTFLKLAECPGLFILVFQVELPFNRFIVFSSLIDCSMISVLGYLNNQVLSKITSSSYFDFGCGAIEVIMPTLSLLLQ